MAGTDTEAHDQGSRGGLGRLRGMLFEVDRRHVAVLLLLLGIGVAFRLRNLGAAPLWIDEAHTSWAGRNFLAGAGFSNPAGPSSPYRRAWLTTSLPVAGAFAVFGLSEFAARLPMAVVGVLAIPLAYLLGAHFNRILGYLVAAFVAVDPFIVVWSRTARMYAPLLLLYLASVYVLLRWYTERDFELLSPHPVALAGLVVLGRETHRAYLAFGIVALSFLVVIFVGRLWRQDDRSLSGIDEGTRRTGILLGLGLLAAVAFLALRGIPAVLTTEPAPTWPDRGPLYYWTFLGDAYFLLRLLAVAGAVYCWWRYEEARLVVLAVLIPLLVASITPKKAPRYVVHLAPLIAFLGLVPIADGFHRAWDRITEDADDIGTGNLAVAALGPVFVIVILAAPVAGYAVADSPYNPPHQPTRSDWPAASEFVSERAEADDLIISTRPELSVWYFGRTDYYFRKRGLGGVTDEEGRLRHTRTGTVIVSEPADLERVLEQGQDVWLFAGKKFDAPYTDPPARAFVEDRFERVGDEDWINMVVYRYEGPTDN